MGRQMKAMVRGESGVIGRRASLFRENPINAGLVFDNLNQSLDSFSWTGTHRQKLKRKSWKTEVYFTNNNSKHSSKIYKCIIY